MEVQGSLGRQIQGISQQPAAVRLQGQCTDAVNTVPDVVDGLKSRMGSAHIARLIDTGHDDMAVHHYRRGDGDEEYFFLMRPGEVPSIFDKRGRRCHLVSQDAPMTYLAGANNPREDVQFMTIADVTFMLNRRKIVRTRGDRSPKVGNTALVFSAYGQYGTKYQIRINGQIAAEYKTKDGGSADHVETIRTEVIAEQLFTKLQTWSGVGAYDVSRMGTTIVITRKDGNTDFTVDTEDGSKGKDLVAIKYKVSSTDLLPSKAPTGYKVQVWPTGSKPESRYWLEAEPSDGNLVTWKETIAADELLGFDKSTMPYVIERTGFTDGVANFLLKQGSWEDRKVGDDLTNPMPSFIDDEVPQSLGGMFMVQNRLCFTAGEAVIMSRTSRFFDFFKPTVLSALDTDPIDIFSDASEVYTLRHAVTLDGDTVLFSDKSQFILPGDKVLTPSTALLRPTTTFEVNNKVSPVVTGDSVMFSTTDGAYSNIREFYTDSYADTKKAQPTTSHVSKLIEGEVIRMESSTNFNRLFVISKTNQSIIYVYDWLWQGTDRVQSAWHKWKFPDTAAVRGMFYSLEKLYILIERSQKGVFLEVMDMGDGYPNPPRVDQARFDRRTELTLHYDAASEEWVSDPIPWELDTNAKVDCILQSGWPSYIGGAFNFRLEDGRVRTQFDLGPEDHPVSCLFGQLYTVEFEPTQVVIKDQQERVSYIDVPTVGLIYLNLDRYPDFDVEVKNLRSGRVRTVHASNRRGGALNNTVGYVKPSEGTFRFPLRAKSTDVTYRIKVTSPHTFQLRDIEWIGSYNPRRRRV